MSQSLTQTIKDGLGLFAESYRKTKKQMVTSLTILTIVTIAFAFLMWIAEQRANPDFDIIDGLVWTFVKYVEDPAEISTAPLTGLGQLIGTLVGVLGIAIFAVPAGLIGSGLIDAMDDNNRKNELMELRKRIKKAFRRDTDKIFNKYLKKLGIDEEYCFVPQEIPVYKIQARQNIVLEDIIDCCKEYPEMRLKNIAQTGTTTEDLFVVEYAYLNRCYGAFIDRQSKVTIVSTSSYAEKGTGWFAYYLALLGGFNFVSKDLEVDPDDQDPFYNFNGSPLHDMTTLEKIGISKEKPDKMVVKKLMLKQEYRKAYLSDLASCHKGHDSWYIVIKEAKESEQEHGDFYLNANRKDGTPLIVEFPSVYSELCTAFSKMISEDGMKTIISSNLYNLKESNSIYRMAKEHHLQCNCFVLRPASAVMNNERKLIVAFNIARLLSKKLDDERGLQPEGRAELMQQAFGFGELEEYEKDKTEKDRTAQKNVDIFMRNPKAFKTIIV